MVQTFARSVVFLLDRSGSMSGHPMKMARESIIFGLDQVRGHLDNILEGSRLLVQRG